MSEFEEFMTTEYPHYKSAGKGNIKMWKHIWNAAIKHAGVLKHSYNSDMSAIFCGDCVKRFDNLECKRFYADMYEPKG